MKRKAWMFALVALVASLALAMPAAAAKIKINIGSTYGPDAPVHFGQVKFKELVEQRSKGEMEVLVHVGGAMGGERDVFEAMSSGGLEMGAMGSGDTGIFFPKYHVFEVPYVMRDADHFWKFWNGPVGKEINDISLNERGVMTAGVVYRGARYLTANKPITTLAELKGLKIRLPENKVWIKIWETLGALPVVVAFLFLMLGFVDPGSQAGGFSVEYLRAAGFSLLGGYLAVRGSIAVGERDNATDMLWRDLQLAVLAKLADGGVKVP